MKTIRLRLDLVARCGVLNSSPMSGIEPRNGTLLLALARLVGDQAAEHDDAAVLDQHRWS